MKIFIAALVLALASPAQAGEYEDIARSALEWIAENSDYSADVSIPPVRIVTQEDLVIMVHGRLPGPNEHFLIIAAAYLSDPPTIWADGEFFDLSGNEAKHTVMHELVHHLQYLSGKEYACIGEMEREAYRLSDKYAEEVLHDESLKADPLTLFFITECPRYR